MPEGGCFCGACRFSYTGEPQVKALCHCIDCRKIGGSTYSTNIIVSADGFKNEKGTPKTISKKADGGNEITSHFCPDCGSTMWRDGDSFPGMKVVKVGMMDDLDALDKAKPVAELYTPARVSWVPAIEGAQQAQTMK